MNKNSDDVIRFSVRHWDIPSLVNFSKCHCSCICDNEIEIRFVINYLLSVELFCGRLHSNTLINQLYQFYD